jgi:hypothetical protein
MAAKPEPFSRRRKRFLGVSRLWTYVKASFSSFKVDAPAKAAAVGDAAPTAGVITPLGDLHLATRFYDL